MMTIIFRYPALIVGVVIGPLMAAASLAGGGSPAEAAAALVIVLGYGIAVTSLGRRSETASALAGRPVDERWEHINLEACAYALGISAIVVLAAFLVAEITNGTWQPYAWVAAVMAVSYLGSLLLVRARH
jgi:hypothetical protein